MIYTGINALHMYLHVRDNCLTLLMIEGDHRLWTSGS